MNQIFLETRMFRLSDGEEIMTLAFFVLIQYRSVTDRRTDIPPLAIPAVCTARYANALVIKARYDWYHGWDVQKGRRWQMIGRVPTKICLQAAGIDETPSDDKWSYYCLRNKLSPGSFWQFTIDMNHSLKLIWCLHYFLFSYFYCIYHFRWIKNAWLWYEIN